LVPHTDIADYTRCPHCLAAGDERGFAGQYLNNGGDLWALCLRHRVRSYVTREMRGAIPDIPYEPGDVLDWPVVDAVLFGAPRT
jgi:hypothetical protein